MGHFSHFRFPKQEKQPAFIKTKKQYVAFYVPAHYYFPERILQPLTKIKRARKQDSSLWVISLIMPLYVGSLCFLSIRSKTNTRSVGFLEYHIYHRPVRPVKTDSANVEKMNLSSPPGQIFFFLVSSKPNRQLCNFLRRKKRNSTIALASCCPPSPTPLPRKI